MDGSEQQEVNKEKTLEQLSVEAVKKYLRVTYVSAGGELGNYNALEVLKIYLGDKFSEVKAKKQIRNTPGVYHGTPLDDASQDNTDFVRLEIKDDSLKGVIEMYRNNLPQEVVDMKDDHFPPYRIGYAQEFLFGIAPTKDEQEGTIFISNSKYQMGKEITGVAFYFKRETYKEMAKEALGVK